MKFKAHEHHLILNRYAALEARPTPFLWGRGLVMTEKVQFSFVSFSESLIDNHTY